MEQVEIIEFKNPTIQRLHFSNIKWFDSEEALIIFLKSKIASYGLVHSVIAKTAEYEEDWYAYVDMYSKSAVEKTYKDLSNNLLINSKKCKIKKVKGRRTDLPLAKDKCETLANYYLGFNGWTTKLLYHRHESSEPLKTTSTDKKCETQTEKYASAIRIHLPYVQNGNLNVEGVGIGVSDWNAKCPEGKGKARSFASKQSRTAALQNAFSKLILVVLNDGQKVTAEIDLQAIDPFVYNPIWDTPSIVVNEVCYEEEDELNDSDFNNMSQLDNLA